MTVSPSKQEKSGQVRRFALLLSLLLLSCGQSSTPVQQHSEGEHEAIARTEFSNRIENFFEYSPLVPGKASHFLIHLTNLSTGKPVKNAEVELIVTDKAATQVAQVTAKVGKVQGIYVAELNLAEVGTYEVLFQVKTDKFVDQMQLSGFEVSAESHSHPPEDEGSGVSPVSFLMEQQWLIDMKLAQVEEAQVSPQLIVTGRVVPASNSQAVVSSPVSGLLQGGYLPRVGVTVSMKEPLVSIQQTPTASESAQLLAASAQVQAAYAQTAAQIQTQNAQIRSQNAQSRIENARLEAEKRSVAEEVTRAHLNLQQAKRDLARARSVYKIEAISTKQLSEFELRLKTEQAAYDSALARRGALASARPIPVQKPLTIQAGQQSIDSSSPTLFHTLQAPLPGVVTKVHKSLGEQVSPGEPILEISNLNTVWLEVPIFERDLGRIDDQATATFSIPAYPEREFHGSAVDVGRVFDAQTRAATALFSVPNSDHQLRLGMQAEVRLNAAGSLKAIMVPKDSVLETEGKKTVYVLLSGEEFERREVVLGQHYGNTIAVLSGLEAGERVVTQGAYQLRLQELSPAEPGVHSHEV